MSPDSSDCTGELEENGPINFKFLKPMYILIDGAPGLLVLTLPSNAFDTVLGLKPLANLAISAIVSLTPLLIFFATYSFAKALNNIFIGDGLGFRNLSILPLLRLDSLLRELVALRTGELEALDLPFSPPKKLLSAANASCTRE